MFTSFWYKYGEQVISLAKSAALTAIGAGVTVALRDIGNIDFGTYTPYVATGIAFLANVLRKFGIPVISATAKLVKGGL